MCWVLSQTDASLLADLIAGRSAKENAAFDCDVDLVLKIWGLIPVPKTLHSVSEFGSHAKSTTSNTESTTS